MPPLCRTGRCLRSRAWSRAVPALSGAVATLFAGLIALALTVAGGGSASATVAPCQADAQAAAGAPYGNLLSTSFALEIMCDHPAQVEVRAPGGAGSAHLVPARSPLRIEDERAYLCEGHDAQVEITSRALGWVQSVAISGIDGLPQCDVLLRPGSTRLHWSGPGVEIRQAFAGAVS